MKPIFDRNIDKGNIFLVEIKVSGAKQENIIVLADNFTHAANKIEKMLRDELEEFSEGRQYPRAVTAQKSIESITLLAARKII